MQPEFILLAILTAGLTLYTLWGGADFGAGVWEFNTRLRDSDKEKEHSYRAIGPVWEANHVWLIFVVVGLFSGFPVAFAAISQALWVPLLLAMVGIMFRGSSFAFRSYTGEGLRMRKVWEALFALGSTAAPFFLGACAGAVASGDLQITADGHYQGNYLTGWITPLSIFTAFFVVGMDAYLAAVYLAREAVMVDDPHLVRLWRRRALANGVWIGVLSIAGLVFLATSAPILWQEFVNRSWPLVAVAVASGFLSLWALYNTRMTLATLFSSTAVATVLWSWIVAQYPYLIPPAITIEGAKSPDNVLWAMIWSIAAGSVLLLPSLAFLFYLFKGKPAAKP